MQTVEPTTLAYLAGMIDADGYISIQRSTHAGRLYFGPKVGIAGTSSEPHKLAASIWGGNVGRFVPKNPVHKAQYQWTRCGRSAVEVIKAIQPYLLVKSQQADLALTLWEHLEDGRSDDPYPWYGPHYDPVPYSESLRAEVVALHCRVGRRPKASAGRLLDGREWSEFPTLQSARI